MNIKYLTPVVTAFNEKGEIDHKGNKNIYDHLIKGGVDGIVIMGSSGEFFAMNMDQKKELIEIAAKHINKRTKLIVGTSCMTPDETIEISNYAHDMGADAVMIVSPYYFNLSKESIEFFYDKVAKGTKSDIYLYNFPERTGYDLTPEITLNLVRKNKNIIGYKDTVTQMGHTRFLINAMHKEFPDFEIFSGFDENLTHNALCGGAGVIGGLSNLIPEVCAAWVKAINKGDFEKIVKHQRFIDKMMEIYNIGNPFMPVLKKAMMMRKIDIKDYSTEPFIRPDEKQTEQIKELLEKMNLI